MDEPNWLLWARELQAIAQTGLTFSNDRYDIERYQRLRAIAVAMLASGSGARVERVSALFEQDLGYPTPKVDVRGGAVCGAGGGAGVGGGGAAGVVVRA